MKTRLFKIIFTFILLVILYPINGYSQIGINARVYKVNCNKICIDFGGTIEWSSYTICGQESPFRFIKPVECKECCFSTLGNTGDCELVILGVGSFMINIPECLPLTVEPSVIKSGLILPRFVQIIINCENCYFD